ncbi:hypothetical protein H6795_02350 [Candidatus Nomurabacteria bacterium]|nr:hypothetical protein [Candidatus Nomurabacteria bacterium]
MKLPDVVKAPVPRANVFAPDTVTELLKVVAPFRVLAPVPVEKVVAPVWEKLPVVVIAPELSTPSVVVPVTPSVPPMVALLVTLRPVPAPVALKPPLKVEAVAVLAPLPVTVARVSASLARPQLPHISVVALLVRH